MALISCPECNGQVSDHADNCIHCGFPLTKAKVAGTAAPKPLRLLEGNQNYDLKSSQERSSSFEDRQTQRVIKSAKSRGVFVILGLFFGFLGIHNFYAGYFGRGAAQLVIVATLGWLVVGLIIVFIWVLIELFTITYDSAGDKMV